MVLYPQITQITQIQENRGLVLSTLSFVLCSASERIGFLTQALDTKPQSPKHEPLSIKLKALLISVICVPVNRLLPDFDCVAEAVSNR
jgi:hypothetical protein